MTEQKHTPLPWKVNDYRPYGLIARDPKENTYNRGDDTFEVFVSFSGDRDTQKANAEFIVKACNSYYTTRRDTLLEVAELARARKNEEFPVMENMRHHWEDVYEVFAQDLEQMAGESLPRTNEEA